MTHAHRNGHVARRAAPLEGIRVLDVSHVFAMPYATGHLSDLGAQVIRIQTPTRLDMMTEQGPFPENEPGERFWARVGSLNTLNRGKLGLALDLTRPEAIDVFKRLVAISDIVVESFTPRVMKKFGLDYAALTEIKPDIIMLSNTGYGHSGPWSDYGSAATSLEATSGACWLSGYAGGAPSKVGQSYTDFLACWNGVFAMLAALRHRRRTGRGQWIDLAMYQAGAGTLGIPILDAIANARVQTRIGNAHPFHAPHGVYPCAGEDQWIAIAVDSDAAWQALRQAMGDPEWAQDARFIDSLARLHHHAELDRHLSEWTTTCDRDEVAAQLQAVGVMAGPVRDARDLCLDEDLHARGFFERITHPPASGVGTRPYIARSWRMSAAQVRIAGPAPMLGEHNEYVLSAILGLSEADIDHLASVGAIADRPRGPARIAALNLDQLRRRGRIGRSDPEYQRRLAIEPDMAGVGSV